MSLAINYSSLSQNALRNLDRSSSSLSRSLQRISSGLRINSAKDDAAGLAISERLTSQIRGANQAQRNANDAVSLTQTAEGTISSINDQLQRIRELAVQSANSTNSKSDRLAMQDEVSERLDEIRRVLKDTEFNGIKLLDGTFTEQGFQVGANVGETIPVSIPQLDTPLWESNSGSRTSTGWPLLEGELTVNGYPIPASKVGSEAGQGNNSAWSKAEAIRSAGIPNIIVRPYTQIEGVAPTTFSDIASGDLTVNGISLGPIPAGTDAKTQSENIVSAINLASKTTGVTATVNQQYLANALDVPTSWKTPAQDAIVLVADDGRNITVNYSGSATGSNTGLAAGGYGNQNIVFSQISTTQQRVKILTTGQWTFTASNPVPIYRSIDPLSIDISTQEGANEAMITADIVLDHCNTVRASLGSYQNRFASVINNLQNNAENLTAARSRISDADFAIETADLTKSQIMQQAGNAMLAQANALPQLVLSLIRQNQ